MKRISLPGIVPVLALTAFGLGPSSAEYERIAADAEPLRAAFNADAGKVRILMLVAPT